MLLDKEFEIQATSDRCGCYVNLFVSDDGTLQARSISSEELWYDLACYDLWLKFCGCKYIGNTYKGFPTYQYTSVDGSGKTYQMIIVRLSEEALDAGIDDSSRE